MANKELQLKITNDKGVEELVFPMAVPEFVTFEDGKTLLEKINDIGNAHNHALASVTKNGFMSKEDFAKLSALTNYAHPSTHPASIIAQDANNKFVTDAQINAWNAKASTATATSTASGLMSKEDKQKVDKISSNFEIAYDSSTETINFVFK